MGISARTGQRAGKAGLWRCTSCQQAIYLEIDNSFPECPNELRRVEWLEVVQEPVAVGVGGLPDKAARGWENDGGRLPKTR